MSKESIVGAKAGGDEQRQPYIAPDSARSVTRLQQVIGLSEGEIKGFGVSNIKLDGTPLSALSTSIKCDYRFGSSNQTSIDGVDEVANEIGVSVELRSDREWTKAITNTNLDALGLRLRWSPLVTNHENGDRTGVRIVYRVHIAPTNGSYALVLDGVIDDKTADSYERYHEFKLPPSNNGWMIRVVRETPNSESSLITDKMYVQAYSEIIKSKFNYPFTSLIALEYDAQTFPNIAKVSVEAEGMIIKVPTNYDPIARTYSGIWNGLFKLAYTNNPAWIYYDLVTNPRYGLGDKIKVNMVDKWALYKLAMYCDQMISDGYGGIEPRFTCNVYLQSKERAYDILNRLTGLFRAINFWSGTEIVVDADIPQDTSYLYTNANVIDGLFEYAGTPATDRYSVVKVAWDNPLNAYSTEYEAVSYEHLIKELGFRVLELDAWGCTSRGQAIRAGRWALLAETDTVTFKVGMDGYLALPGKVIEVQDEFYAGKSNGGRIKSIDATRKIITVDRDVSTIVGDTLSINTNSGEVLKYSISSSVGKVITLPIALSQDIDILSIWVINSSTLVTQKYRVMTIKYDDVGEFTISATAYNPNKYEEIDNNVIFDEPPTSLIKPIAQDSVTDVQIESTNLVYQGLNNVNLTIKWVRAVNAVEYLVEFKKDNGTWLKLPITGNSSVTLDNVYAGTYLARVTAISAFGLNSLPAYSVNTDVLGKLLPPSAPLNFRTSPAMFAVNVLWDFPTNSKDVAFTRIQTSALDPLNMSDLTHVIEVDRAYPETKLTVDGMRIGYPKWFRAKLVDKLGFESPFTSWVQGESNEDPSSVMELISGHINEGSLDQILQGKIEAGVAGEALADAALTVANAAADQATSALAAASSNVAALKAELDPQILALENGVTTLTTNYQSADAIIVGQLNAYKVSNDSSVANVLQKAESAISTGAANSLSITSLNNSVTTINGNIALKADASALSALTTRVTNVEGVNTTQSTSITSLQNTVNHATTGLATKASTSALNTLDTKVTTVDGKTVTNASAITALQGRATTIEGGLSLKLDASAIVNYYTKTEADTATTGKIEAYNATLKIGGENLIQDSKLIAGYLWNGVGYEDSPDMYDPNYYACVGSEKFVGTYYSAEGLATGSGGYIEFYTAAKVFISGVEWIVADQFNSKFITAPANAAFFRYATIAKGIKAKLERGTKATDWSPSTADLRGSIDANASALETTNTEVSRVNNVVIAQGISITNLTASINGKADASALTSLTTRVTNAEGVNTSQATALTNLSTTVGGHTTTINSQTTTINGVKGVHALKIDTDGVISGYGLVSELIDGVVKSQFGVNANTFFIGAPANNKKPFIVLTEPGNINGVTVPAGTYIDTAFIADATIDTAQIRDLNVTSGKIANLAVTSAKIANLAVDTAQIAAAAITSAKIEDLAVTTAKIGNLQVDTLKIKDQAVTVSVAALNVNSLSITTSGGKVRVDIGVRGTYAHSSQASADAPISVRLKRNGVVLILFDFYSNRSFNSEPTFFSYDVTTACPAFVDNPPAGTHTYTVELGFNNRSYVAFPQGPGTADILTDGIGNSSIALMETKK